MYAALTSIVTTTHPHRSKIDVGISLYPLLARLMSVALLMNFGCDAAVPVLSGATHVLAAEADQVSEAAYQSDRSDQVVAQPETFRSDVENSPQTRATPIVEGTTQDAAPAAVMTPFEASDTLFSNIDAYAPVLLSPEDRTLLIRSRLYDVKERRELRPLPVESVDTAAFSHDGQWLATCEDDTLTLGNLKTDTWQTREYIQHASFASHAPWLAELSADGQDVHFVDVTTGKVIRELQLGFEKPAHFTTFAPDGRRLITGSRSRACRMWDIATGEEIPLPGARDSLYGFPPLDFSPDGRMFAEGRREREIRLRRTDDWQQTALVKLSSMALDMQFSPDGRQLWVQCVGDLCVIEVKNARLAKYTRFRERAIGAGLRRDGSEAYVVVDDQIVSYRRGDHQSTSAPRSSVVATTPAERKDRIDTRNLMFAPDGQTLLTFGGNKTRLHSVATGEESMKLPKPKNYDTVIAIATRESTLYQVRQHSLEQFSLRDGSLINEFPITNDDSNIVEAAFSRGGRLLAVAVHEGQVLMIDTTTGRTVGRMDGPAEMRGFAVAPNDQELALAFNDPDGGRFDWIKRYSLPDLKEQGRHQADRDTQTLVYSPDGRFLASWEKWNLIVRDTSTGRRVAIFRRFEQGGFGFTHDGRYLFSAPNGRNSQQARVRLYDTSTWMPVHEFTQGRDLEFEVGRDVVFSPDGHLLLAVRDGTEDQTCPLRRLHTES